MFDDDELRRVYGPDYDAAGTAAMGKQWLDALGLLDEALDARDSDGVESQLGELARLNRIFSSLSTERYLELLKARA